MGLRGGEFLTLMQWKTLGYQCFLSTWIQKIAWAAWLEPMMD